MKQGLLLRRLEGALDELDDVEELEESEGLARLRETLLRVVGDFDRGQLVLQELLPHELNVAVLRAAVVELGDVLDHGKHFVSAVGRFENLREEVGSRGSLGSCFFKRRKAIGDGAPA